MSHPSKIERLFHDLVVGAYADGVLEPEEERLLISTANVLDLGEPTYRAIIRNVANGDRKLRYEGSDEDREQFYALMQSVLLADGELDPLEKALLEKLMDES